MLWQTACVTQGGNVSSVYQCTAVNRLLIGPLYFNSFFFLVDQTTCALSLHRFYNDSRLQRWWQQIVSTDVTGLQLNRPFRLPFAIVYVGQVAETLRMRGVTVSGNFRTIFDFIGAQVVPLLRYLSCTFRGAEKSKMMSKLNFLQKLRVLITATFYV